MDHILYALSDNPDSRAVGETIVELVEEENEISQPSSES